MSKAPEATPELHPDRAKYPDIKDHDSDMTLQNFIQSCLGIQLPEEGTEAKMNDIVNAVKSHPSCLVQVFVALKPANGKWLYYDGTVVSRHGQVIFIDSKDHLEYPFPDKNLVYGRVLAYWLPKPLPRKPDAFDAGSDFSENGPDPVITLDPKSWMPYLRRGNTTIISLAVEQQLHLGGLAKNTSVTYAIEGFKKSLHLAAQSEDPTPFYDLFTNQVKQIGIAYNAARGAQDHDLRAAVGADLYGGDETMQKLFQLGDKAASKKGGKKGYGWRKKKGESGNSQGGKTGDNKRSN